MSKLSMKNIKTWITSFTFVFFLFFIFLFLQNGTSLIMTMESTKNTPIQAKFYFTKEGQPYIEKNSRQAYKVEKNNYFFKLPKPEEMQYLRFDPTRKEMNISIKKITLSQTKWFKKSLYDIATTNIIPVNQISEFKASGNEVNFSTTGNDPHFNMRLSSTHISTTHHIYVNLFIIAILLISVLMFLIHLYIINKPDNNPNLILDREDFSICQN